MDQMPWILEQWTGRSSSTEASGDHIKKSSGKRISGWLCLQIRWVLVRAIGKQTAGSTNGQRQVSEMLTLTRYRTILIPSVTIAIRRAIFHPSAQREKETEQIARAKERAEKVFQEKAMANFSPKVDGT